MKTQPDRGGKVLYRGALTATAAALYTVPSNVRAVVHMISASNDSGASRDVHIYVDPDDTTYAVTDALWNATTITDNADKTEQFEHGLELTAGGSIGGKVDSVASNGVTVFILGQEYDLEIN